MPLHKLTVQPTDAGERVDVWVAHALGLSRAQVKELAEGPGIRVNGRRVKRGDKLEAGAEVTLSWEPPSLELTVEHAPLTVLYEDAQLVAVDKPAQMASHPLKPGEVGTVANALAALHPECVQASEDPREGGLCHRLDGETSGVLLAARSREAWTAMRSAFSERRVDKSYWALVNGPLADEGEIDLPLRHSARGETSEPAVEGGEGTREALSRFRVLAREGVWSFVQVQILTGVLHQVRAHLAAIGAPIAGDARYGGAALPGLTRFFLHARSLGFTQPVTGKRVDVLSPLPGELSRVLAERGFTPSVGG